MSTYDMSRGILMPFAALTAILFFPLLAEASTMTYYTIPGATVSGEAVDAEVDFTTGTDSLSITIRNNLEDPNSPKQVAYGVEFVLSTGQTNATLVSTAGLERTVSSGGTYADGGTGSSGWQLDLPGGSTLLLTALGGGQPEFGVIGPPNSGTDLYGNGGGSITGTSHNPFFALQADFELSVPGLTMDHTVQDVRFLFNTSGTDFVRGHMPEPSTLFMSLVGMVGVGLYGRRRRVVAQTL